MHTTCTRHAHDMLCAVSIIKRQVQRTSCHKSPTPHHLIPTCHPASPTCLQMSLIHHQLFRVTWFLQVQHDAFRCNMTHLYVTWIMHVWYDSCRCNMTQLCVKWLIHVWHDSCMCDTTHLSVTCIDSCHTTRPYIHPYSCFLPRQKKQEAPPRKRPIMNLKLKEPYCPSNEPNSLHVWHDSFVVATWRMDVWNIPIMRMTWLFHTWHDSFILDMTYPYVKWLIHLWHAP